MFFAVCVIYIKSRLYILTVKCCLVCYKKNSHLVDVIIVIIAYNSTILAMYDFALSRIASIISTPDNKTYQHIFWGFFVSAYWVYSQEWRHFKCTANAYANGCKHVLQLQCSYATDL